MNRLVVALLAQACLLFSLAHAGEAYYIEDQVFQSRPPADREMDAGHIGPTGIKARFYKGVILKVEAVEAETPASGKFTKGDVITGVNGNLLKGKNPFVTLGNAITQAEAGNGKITFDVISGKATKTVTLSIPVLGAYSKTWPVDCPKSKRVVANAAKFYADKRTFKQTGMTGALACLFLLSTGDDAYLPRVKEYFQPFVKNLQGIGEHTWNNGYNGIACAEYYLRTGDKEVLPVLQYFCDDARDRQKFGGGWVHWGTGISPRYVASGLMNPAGVHELTTLLLGKECGVNVDEKTLSGALKFFYRFAGHGTVPYGDHRGEGGLGSNGKDSMLAVSMQIASGAQGDVSIYEQARDHLSMSTITNYPSLVRGHADEGRGDGMWRGVASSYLSTRQPADYRAMMDRLTWWYDLSRTANGGIGIATCQRFNDIGSGAGVALGYTAHLKTLRITGAAPSKFAKDFTLPERLWGTEADLAFYGIEHNPTYKTLGKTDPVHVPFFTYGSAYSKPSGDLKKVPLSDVLKNIHHRRYMIRVQAAKTLRIQRAFGEIEKLLKDPDPRIRRTALDGIIDYNYWFGMGRGALKPNEYTPGMIKTIVAMTKDSKEAWYVIDGALFAMKNMPANVIQENLDAIMPWTTHEEWWLRESSFAALSGLDKDPVAYAKILPKLIKMMTVEYHTQPRDRMLSHLKRQVNDKNRSTPVGTQILTGFKDAVKVSVIKKGVRSPEGAYNVKHSAKASIEKDPESAVVVAKIIRSRFDVLATGDLLDLVAAPNANRENKPYGFCTLLDKLDGARRKELTDILYDDYRAELVARMKVAKGNNLALMDTIVDLIKLKEAVAGWHPLGTPKPVDRLWRYTSFDPQTEKETVHPREKKRFRDITLPKNLEGWFKPEFDDKSLTSGKGPIGVGLVKRGNVSFINNSPWGDGEFLVMRSTFELDAVDCDYYRLSILARQGFHVYLNGKKIHTYIWWKDMPHYRVIMLGPNETKYLKKGTNVLAAYGNVEYDKKTGSRLGQMDLFIEGLKKKDLE